MLFVHFYLIDNTIRIYRLTLHSLKRLKSEINSDQNSRRNGAVDAICDIYNLLRRAANNINKCNGQRFTMLNVMDNLRNKSKDTSLDTVYIMIVNMKFYYRQFDQTVNVQIFVLLYNFYIIKCLWLCHI